MRPLLFPYVAIPYRPTRMSLSPYARPPTFLRARYAVSNTATRVWVPRCLRRIRYWPVVG
eukprot:1026829-Rhodomonas_salina.1